MASSIKDETQKALNTSDTKATSEKAPEIRKPLSNMNLGGLEEIIAKIIKAEGDRQKRGENAAKAAEVKKRLNQSSNSITSENTETHVERLKNSEPREKGTHVERLKNSRSNNGIGGR